MKVWLMLTINKGYGVGSYDCKKKRNLFIYQKNIIVFDMVCD